MQGNLENPILNTALCSVKKRAFFVEMKESFLDDVLGFAGITHNSAGDPEHQAGVAVKKNLQSAGIVRLQTGHCVFVARDSRFRDMRRASHAFPARVPHHWKCKSASWRHKTHA